MAKRIDQLSKAELLAALREERAGRRRDVDRLRTDYERKLEFLKLDLETFVERSELSIAELGHMKQELEESRDRYVDLFEFAPIPYLMIDMPGVIREINFT